MFEALKTPRRVILSGTPIQNELSEFHAMVSAYFAAVSLLITDLDCQADFCNPGLLGECGHDNEMRGGADVFTKDDYSTFKRVYETPILKSRAPGCSAKEAEVGEARSAQVRSSHESCRLSVAFSYDDYNHTPSAYGHSEEFRAS